MCSEKNQTYMQCPIARNFTDWCTRVSSSTSPIAVQLSSSSYTKTVANNVVPAFPPNIRALQPHLLQYTLPTRQIRHLLLTNPVDTITTKLPSFLRCGNRYQTFRNNISFLGMQPRTRLLKGFKFKTLSFFLYGRSSRDHQQKIQNLRPFKTLEKPRSL